ncbi:glutaredoxin family protein [Bacilli bacterium]|nr:glutaredoxin [Bacilli bacterium VT-13-104]MBU8790270.1 glutaredoxin family protein [Oceanobacillus caeni]PZD89650.1 glutaredoxin family protein [Bacilli bacterium]PZD91172.1 glutaredoxin family protein [Bacilli bacterium]PZD92719.1 glutaredoxin family protein [Bacilli bacterium]
MLHINFYTKENCSLCVDAEALLSTFKRDYPYELEMRDIYSNDDWLEKYQLLIPVIEVNGKQLNCEEINYDSVKRLLKEEHEEDVGNR